MGRYYTKEVASFVGEALKGHPRWRVASEPWPPRWHEMRVVPIERGDAGEHSLGFYVPMEVIEDAMDGHTQLSDYICPKIEKGDASIRRNLAEAGEVL